VAAAAEAVRVAAAAEAARVAAAADAAVAEAAREALHDGDGSDGTEDMDHMVASSTRQANDKAQAGSSIGVPGPQSLPSLAKKPSRPVEKRHSAPTAAYHKFQTRRAEEPAFRLHPSGARLTPTRSYAGSASIPPMYGFDPDAIVVASLRIEEKPVKEGNRSKVRSCWDTTSAPAMIDAKFGPLLSPEMCYDTRPSTGSVRTARRTPPSSLPTTTSSSSPPPSLMPLSTQDSGGCFSHAAGRLPGASVSTPRDNDTSVRQCNEHRTDYAGERAAHPGVCGRRRSGPRTSER